MPPWVCMVEGEIALMIKLTGIIQIKSSSAESVSKKVDMVSISQ